MRLEACLEKVEQAPQAAYEDALNWIYEGSRPEARQCLALSLLATGRLSEGALELEALARAPDGGSVEDRVTALTIAADAWLEGEAWEQALGALDSARRLNAQADVALARAKALGGLARWTEAAAELDRAATNGGGAAVMRERARARLNLGQLEGALADAEAALAADPRDVDALVVRGNVREALRRAG
jgi:tetratricopeptide (TPR) repeat protein